MGWKLDPSRRYALFRREGVEMKIRTERFVLVLLLGLGFLALVGALLFLNVPEKNRDLLNVMIGTLGTTFITAIGRRNEAA